MRLLAITGYYKPAYIYGGTVTSESSLYENQSKLGTDVTVITTNKNGNNELNVPLCEKVDVEGVKVYYCPTRQLPGSPFYSPSLVKLAKQHIPNVDIVHLQTFWGYSTRKLSQLCLENKTPYFVTPHGQLMDYGMNQMGLLKTIKKKIFLSLIGFDYLNNAAALHLTSHLEAEQLKPYPINTPKFIIPNGLDVDYFQTLPPSGLLRKRLNIPKNAMVLAMIGRLHYVKSPQIGVSALIASQKLQKDVHLIMVGPDEENFEAILRDQAHKAGCSNRLHFTGFLNRDEIKKAMRDIDLLLMPSKSENFGMSAAEAMASGLPIITTDRVPVGYWAKEENAGEIVPLDSDLFTHKVVEMLKDPTRLKIMGKNGNNIAKKVFDEKIIAKTMLSKLEEIIKEFNR